MIITPRMRKLIEVEVLSPGEIFPIFHLPKDDLWLLSSLVLEKPNVRTRYVVSHSLITEYHIKEAINIIEMLLNADIGPADSLDNLTNGSGPHDV